MSHPDFTAQLQSITTLWLVLISLPTEDRRLSCPGNRQVIALQNSDVGSDQFCHDLKMPVRLMVAFCWSVFIVTALRQSIFAYLVVEL